MRRHLARIVGLALLAGVLTASAEARITRIEIVKVEPAFGGQSFGTAGAFEHVFARAHGELDPSLPANSIIQDLGLAPRNARGMVEYTSDVEMLRPADPATSNRILLFDVINRGNKVVQRLYDADVPPNVTDNNALAAAGDGWLQRQGYTLVWFGWQADVLPGGGRMTLTVPVAANQDGSPLTGTVRSELITLAPTTTLPLSAGWFTGAIHAPYPTVSVDNRTALADGFLPTLTERARETAPRITVANTAW
ncbi:MAG TPA: hypothetical protein VFE12_19395, partial [Acetobacteraceae bacterium]|nr:hypothetical protein [Acetobacteraceae bacterium]